MHLRAVCLVRAMVLCLVCVIEGGVVVGVEGGYVLAADIIPNEFIDSAPKNNCCEIESCAHDCAVYVKADGSQFSFIPYL